MGFSPLKAFRSNHPLIRFLGSVRLAVVLLVAIGVACIAGTLIIQANAVPGSPVEVYNFYLRKYGAAWHRVFNALSLYRLYSSGWFSALLLLLVVNMVVCALRRLRWKWTQLGFQLTHLSIVFLLVGVVVGLHGREGQMTIFEGEQSSTVLLRGRPRVANSPEDARALAREAMQDGGAPLARLDFALFLEDFELRRQAEPLDSVRVQSARRGQRQSYNLVFTTRIPRAAGEPWDVEVLETKPLLRRTSRVVEGGSEEGEPAFEIEVQLGGRRETGWLFAHESHNRLRLPNDCQVEYRRCLAREELEALRDQETFGTPLTTDSLEVTLGDAAPTTLPLRIGNAYALAGTSLTLTVRQFFPDWKLDRERHQAFSPTNERRNPAIEVRLEAGETSRTLWVFSRFPDFQPPPEIGGRVVALRFLEANRPEGHLLRLVDLAGSDERFLQRYDRGRLVETLAAEGGTSVTLPGGLRVGLVRYLKNAITDTTENEDPNGFVARLRLRERQTGRVEENDVPSGEWFQQGHLLFRFDREYPIDQFISHVRVLEDGRPVLRTNIEMNAPLKYRRYIFYQSSYDTKAGEASRYTVLSVKRDPGVWFVYIGFGILTLGLVVVFYVNPWLRRGPGERGT